MTELVTRLEVLRERLNLSQKEFAEMGRSTRTTYNTWVTKEGKQPTTDFITNIKKAKPNEIDLDWLFMGFPKMFVSEPQDKYNPKNNECEEKLKLAYQLIETQKIAIESLQQQVSSSVSKNKLEKFANA
jgi:transcriptional regulator with XRE-family HTH domain